MQQHLLFQTRWSGDIGEGQNVYLYSNGYTTSWQAAGEGRKPGQWTQHAPLSHFHVDSLRRRRRKCLRLRETADDRRVRGGRVCRAARLAVRRRTGRSVPTGSPHPPGQIQRTRFAPLAARRRLCFTTPLTAFKWTASFYLNRLLLSHLSPIISFQNENAALWYWEYPPETTPVCQLSIYKTIHNLCSHQSNLKHRHVVTTIPFQFPAVALHHLPPNENSKTNTENVWWNSVFTFNMPVSRFITRA